MSTTAGFISQLTLENWDVEAIAQRLAEKTNRFVTVGNDGTVWVWGTDGREESGDWLDQESIDDCIPPAFGRLNLAGDVDLLDGDGSPITVLSYDFPIIWPVDSNVSAHHEHPGGLVITTEDASRLGVDVEVIK